MNLKIVLSLSLLLMLATISSSVDGQTLPVVRIDERAVEMQSALYPNHYRDHSATGDLRWVRKNDSTLVAFWEENGDSLLSELRVLSGLNWAEPEITMFLLRYYPSVGSGTPLVIPVGGMRGSSLVEAAPSGCRMQFNLIYQLSQRMLAQAERADDPWSRGLVGHPMMQPGKFRRDNVAMLLALVVAQRVIGMDSTYAAYESEFWKQRTPGRQVLEDYMLNEWILSESRPLAVWVVEEPISSPLVRASRAPRRVNSDDQPTQPMYIKGLPISGYLGFSIKRDIDNRLLIDQIDIRRLAYASGLRQGDVIRQVDGVRVRSHKKLIELILTGLEKGGAVVTFIRDDQTTTIVIQPLDLAADEYQSDDYFVPDSIDIPVGVDESSD